MTTQPNDDHPPAELFAALYKDVSEPLEVYPQLSPPAQIRRDLADATPRGLQETPSQTPPSDTAYSSLYRNVLLTFKTFHLDHPDASIDRDITDLSLLWYILRDHAEKFHGITLDPSLRPANMRAFLL